MSAKQQESGSVSMCRRQRRNHPVGLHEYGHVIKQYIRRDFLKLSPKDFTATEELVSECASRVHNTLMHQDIEPGTKEAFLGYVACLHQLYLYGVAVQLKRMGYHMTRI